MGSLKTSAVAVCLGLCLGACGAAAPVTGAPTVAGGPTANIAASSAAPERPAGPADPWRQLLAGPAKTHLDGPGGGLVVEVSAARALGDAQAVRLVFTQGGAPVPQAPSLAVLGAAQIHLLDASLADADVQDALGAPSPWPRGPSPLPPQTRADGLYADVYRGPDETIVCYGEGPPPDAPDCEDVCFAELCVSDRAGLVEIGGQWAPEAGAFTAPGYADFRTRLTYQRAR